MHSGNIVNRRFRMLLLRCCNLSCTKFHILARHNIHRPRRMLQQSLTNRAKQQTGKAAATARTNNHKIMIQTSLSQSFNSRTRHNSSMNLQIRQTLQNWLHALLKILHIRAHNSGITLSTLHSWHCGNNIKLSMPAIRQISRNFKSFKSPL